MIVAGKLGSRAARQNKTGSTLLSDKVKVEPTHQNPGDHEWRERDSSHRHDAQAVARDLFRS
jgi:hypothetical protein